MPIPALHRRTRIDAGVRGRPNHQNSKPIDSREGVARSEIQMALLLICFARPRESPHNVESISWKSYQSLTQKVVALALVA